MERDHKKCFEELNEIERDMEPKSEKLKEVTKIRDEEEALYRQMDNEHKEHT
jgi:hypothetical protein